MGVGEEERHRQTEGGVSASGKKSTIYPTH